MMNSAFRLALHANRPTDFAVLLNGNAKQVDRQLRGALQRVVPADDLFFSRSHEEARRIAETVIERGYQTVFTGGGDGTFVSWVNAILDHAADRRVPAPRFGVLALGTGNAVAEVVGARRDAHLEHLTSYARGNARCYRRLDLLVCNGRRTPFAGIGIDAAVINDYNWLKGALADTALASLATGVPGYGLAIALRSAPRHMLERTAPYCEIVNQGGPAYRLDARGRRIGRAIGHGELLYAGPLMLAAASTVPFYGFGLKAFPFADTSPGLLQLRLVTQVPVPALIWNLQRVWSGNFEHPGLLDFHADRISVRCDRPVPLQVGGDAEGAREEVTFGIAPVPVELVDFAASERRPRLLPN